MLVALMALGCRGTDEAGSPPGCDPTVDPAPIPRQLRLLTRREYDRTVADLLPGLAGGAACLDDAGCSIELESCVAGTCQPDPCELVTFLYPSDGHESVVSVAGTFNGWSADAWPMAYVPEHGAWVGKRVVPDGEHLYKFVVDGVSWVADPLNPVTAPDGYGGANSALVQACAGTEPADAGFEPSASFPAESPPSGFPFDTAAETGLVTTVHAEQYAEAAEDLAEQAAGDLPGLLGCADPQESCVEPWVRSFGRRVFRRPLADEEIDRYVALATSQVDLATGVSAALQAMLQSPLFLYRSEIGIPVAGGFQLDGPEIATAMSYFLWGTLPDEALLAAAESGSLADPAVRAAQAERMLADPRARETLEAFAIQWLDVEHVPSAVRVDPAFDRSLGEAMVEETARSFGSTVFDGSGRFEDLLLGDTTWIDDDLAELYGLPAPADAAWVQVEAPPERRGLLGQASVLTATSHSDQSSPIRRGLFVRERLLCEILPVPPPNVGPVPTVSADATTRERFEEHTENPSCAACHVRIDPIGFGLEAFDAIGRHRAEENGLPIDTSGWIAGLDGAAEAHFEGQPELAALLAGSAQARRCLTTQLWRFAAGRLETEAQQCALSAIDAEAAGDVSAMMVAIVSHPDFVRRSE